MGSLGLSQDESLRHGRQFTKFINGRIAQGDQLVTGDIWISAQTGKILSADEAPQEQNVDLINVVDLYGRILAPGLIDVQLNGAFGFNFSILPKDTITYPKELIRINKALVQTGLTSYLPTLTSQPTEVYQKVLPYLGPSGSLRLAEQGCESLGAHCEGPFLSRTKNGIHNRDNLLSAKTGFQDLETCYGHTNLSSIDGRSPRVKMVTAAPEVGNVAASISELTNRNIIFSIGHSEATYEEACAAVEAGASMVTHLFNAMQPLHHRAPGIIGLLGNSDQTKRPYTGVIADGIHLHPTVANLAFRTNPEGFILVTDAMHLVGLPDGTYQWSSDGDRLVKKGTVLTLEGTPDKIAGSSITLLQCVNNFLSWSNVAVPVALKAVTATPAKMLGLEDVKGTLSPGADADLVVLDEVKHGNVSELVLEQTWKFGAKVYDRHEC
ncbi:N-acetyl-glucosamine-6-phosphate deacetylase [Elasticomyces elasticus]|uniref:N-acetylglucosamine-6-phosphate deacetylase n=1 Tax=Exophiala sideris TaxID=1016849 RepID=A0ABR0J6D2_9EURO|nr:N-acetyl-glucosamine-6-phosphate deacetylase [Elasticomyces elasticus]KAK5028849.1 N-acetyl-glucosamine-6-phosphate deacetylase [Exophiala sideris]KAK5035718.1 N-acetyl-glucosamine-6-phosphate deacetylase [Exophiala sideris]KAK5057353.1 N-acetyl-glucosamine-6-phosphate deacetylase [Exophiala sideris]KAK5181673.1 N-acetyl-glucosamine-6-phosphate deacetylase [Eurotiomycetes sp. CCFEE 6388]